MVAAYRELFRSPGATALTTAGLLARMPLSMVGIGLITMMSQTSGSYALAGALAATYAVSTALAAPQISRLVDRLGQRRVIPVAALLSTIALAALLLTSALHGPDWLLFALAAAAGTAPSAPALVRARWTELHRNSPLLHTAFSWETVLDEVCFIVGPPVSLGLSVALFPQAGPLVAGLLLLTGTLWLAAQRGTEPARNAVSERPSLFSALGNRAVWTVTPVMVAMGTIAGTIDVASIAFAGLQGQPAAAGIVLSVYAVGSCAAGFLFGTVKLSRPIGQLLTLGIVATALMTLPLLFVTSIPALSVTVLISGMFFAPTLILAAQLVEAAVPAYALTEALTWSTAGLGFGIAIGPAAAGPIIDAHGANAGFWVAAAAGAALLALAAVCRHTFRAMPARPIAQAPATVPCAG
ncbi:MFS transporter [Nocardia brasiliensis]|uniref:MFS transporter n=1 Tax=Nocardia brasiliensis TaxID=37326 RepID=UPI003D92D4AE